MTANELTIEMGWQEADRITLADDGVRLVMPSNVPDKPGLYKLAFSNDTFYFGEAGDLQRRVGDYIVYYEGSGIESEFRINSALRADKGARVFYYIGEDVASRSQRCVVEHRLIKDAGKRALNGGKLEDRIIFHAKEIVRLTVKLQKKPDLEGTHE